MHATDPDDTPKPKRATLTLPQKARAGHEAPTAAPTFPVGGPSIGEAARSSAGGAAVELTPQD
jgi:hypothetical protein